MGEGSGREPSGRRAPALLHAAPQVRELRGTQCVARRHVHLLRQGSATPREHQERTVFEMFEAERAALMGYRDRFDGFHATSASVSKTCLVRFDKNNYSVAGIVVAEHMRHKNTVAIVQWQGTALVRR